MDVAGGAGGGGHAQGYPLQETSIRRDLIRSWMWQVVLEEGHKRKVIFSTFDPDCATLLSLKCARYPVFFLTCAGSKHYSDPRMNSLQAALIFAKSSKLQVTPPVEGSCVWQTYKPRLLTMGCFAT